jgi:ectoine hydroxylase-related dioxygenase (phytanoyl-CoA dioxygenase family)
MINSVSRNFLEPNSDGYQLHFTSAIDIAPKESKQILHRDRGVWGGYIPRKIETQLSTVWAITDFTKQNGATQVVPGSHKWEKDRQPSEDEICYAEMSKGSVLIYTGSVMHGGGSNDSDFNRLGVFLHYAPTWLRQEENQYLSCPPHIAKNLSPELRALMGYSKGGYVLGFFSDPESTDGELESVSPEKLFGNTHDMYSEIKSADKLVIDSTIKK